MSAQHKCNCITDQKKLVELQDTNDVRLPQQALRRYITSDELLRDIVIAYEVNLQLNEAIERARKHFTEWETYEDYTRYNSCAQDMMIEKCLGKVIEMLS